MNFSPSRFRSFMAVISPLPARRHAGWRAKQSSNHHPLATRTRPTESRRGNYWQGRWGGGSHARFNLPRVLIRCVITHVGSPRWRNPVFYQVASRIGGESISGVKQTLAEEALKISSLKTTRDIKREVSHLEMIGCPLTRCVYRQHQRSRHSEHDTAAIELAPGQYQVIGPIWEVLGLFWTKDWWSWKHLWHMPMRFGVFFALFESFIFGPGTWKQTRPPYGCALKMDAVC